MIEQINKLLSDALTNPSIRRQLAAGELQQVLAEHGLTESLIAEDMGIRSVEALAAAVARQLSRQVDVMQIEQPSASEGLILLAADFDERAEVVTKPARSGEGTAAAGGVQRSRAPVASAART